MGTEDLDDFRTELQVVEPFVLKHVEQRQVRAMRYEDVVANEDETAKELAMVLDALVEDIFEGEVALNLIGLLYADAGHQLVLERADQNVAFSHEALKFGLLEAHIGGVEGAVYIEWFQSHIDACCFLEVSFCSRLNSRQRIGLCLSLRIRLWLIG